MRLIISAPTEHPTVFAVTKVENIQPIGLLKLTIYQKIFDPHTDYIEKDNNGNIIGMWPDYFESNIKPVNPTTQDKLTYTICASTYKIKVGGSYKLLTLKIYDSSNIDITDNYKDYIFDWSCYLVCNDKNIDLTNQVSWLNGNNFNQKKIKFSNDRKYLNKILNIKCMIINRTNDIKTEIVSQFEIVI